MTEVEKLKAALKWVLDNLTFDCNIIPLEGDNA